MTRYAWTAPGGTRFEVRRGPDGKPVLGFGEAAATYSAKMLNPGEVAFLLDELLSLAERWQEAEERAEEVEGILADQGRCMFLHGDEGPERDAQAVRAMRGHARREARLAELEAAERWIPVEERLPEPEEDGASRLVLIWRPDSIMATGFYCHDLRQWFAEEGSAPVTRWRELPKGPK